VPFPGAKFFFCVNEQEPKIVHFLSFYTGKLNPCCTSSPFFDGEPDITRKNSRELATENVYKDHLGSSAISRVGFSQWPAETDNNNENNTRRVI